MNDAIYNIKYDYHTHIYQFIPRVVSERGSGVLTKYRLAVILFM